MSLSDRENMYGKCDPSLPVVHSTENAPDVYSPGRFFAANELKAIMAYIVVNYDLKIGGDGKRPANIYLAENMLPNPKGEILFRKRAITH